MAVVINIAKHIVTYNPERKQLETHSIIETNSTYSLVHKTTSMSTKQLQGRLVATSEHQCSLDRQKT